MQFSIRHIFFILTFCFCFYAEDVFATHYRAGEITYELIAPFTYRVTVRTIAEDNAADRDTIRVRWGDSSSELLSRTNGPIIGGSHKGEPVGFGFKRNIYIGTHTYPGVPPPPNNYYVISFFDPARVNNVININNGNSVDVPFFVEDTLRFPADIASIGYNSSPIFFQDPFDYGCVNEVFTHSLNPFDPDGDSLTFDIVTPLQSFGLVVPNWKNPQNVPSSNNPNNIFSLNRFTGEIVWTTPQSAGLYNVGIIIREYRRGILMGTILRDFHIIIDPCQTQPPVVSELNDTCIRAGDLLQMLVTASDPDISQIVTLTADGAPFFDTPNPLAVFTAQPPGNPTSGNFSWQPSCNQVRKQPYTVVFKAQDNFIAPGGGRRPLTDAETWLIEVVAPPVQDVTANVLGSTVNIAWKNPYFCSSSSKFRGFSVWRKINSNPFTPEYCETGLAGRGYTRLNSTLTKNYSYGDNSIVRGQQYCYRILAHFSRLSPNGIFEYDFVESVPSDEICVNVPLDIPVITNVSVNTTNIVTGSNFVAWSKPRAGGNQLDTIQNPPPYIFDVYRGIGFNLANPTLVQTYTANSFASMNDTTFTDTLLNTQTTPNSYKIVFKANGDSLGETTIASSVFLSVDPLDKSLRLRWEENVPWTNDSFAIFRQSKTTLLFDSIGVSKTHQYIDTGLINDTTYCYYVKSFGHYSVASLKFPIINLSQENCGKPQDTIAPCPPILAVRNDCEKYNGVAWNDSVFSNILSFSFTAQAGCDNDADHYNIYFSETDDNLSLIDSTADTTYTHIVQNNIAGCYAITAVDRLGNESTRSNQVCIENCSFYDLPNVFTPNGDGQNDIFTPFKPYRFVTRIEFSIFNRWGNKVFETTDPDINWDGRDYKTGVLLNDGLYLYGGYYYEKQRNGEVKKVLPPNKKGGGYIHLIRGN